MRDVPLPKRGAGVLDLDLIQVIGKFLYKIVAGQLTATKQAKNLVNQLM